MMVQVLWRFGFTMMLALASLGVVASASAEAEFESAPYWPTNGWNTSSLASHGMDASLLTLVDQRLRTEAPLLSAFVVVKEGDIVLERYHESYQPDQPLHVWSVSKSITNIAVGLTLEEGLLSGLDQTLGELIPDRIPAAADPRVYLSLIHI